MESTVIYILTAFEEEMQGIKEILDREYKNNKLRFEYFLTGVGEPSSGFFNHLSEKIEREKVDLIVGTGCCGALVDWLLPGDLILPGKILIGQEKDAWQAEQSIHQQVLVAAERTSRRCFSGTIYTSRQVIDKLEDKKDIFQKLDAIGVDMELYYLANFTKERGIPFLPIKYVADTLDQSLPSSAFLKRYFQLSRKKDSPLIKLKKTYLIATNLRNTIKTVRLRTNLKKGIDSLAIVLSAFCQPCIKMPGVKPRT